jgi:hypothetical protein
MGQQAKLKASRRKLAADDRQRMLGFVQEQIDNGVIAAHTEAFLADAEAVALVARDRPAQELRLTAAGWHLNQDRGACVDGLGCWGRVRPVRMRLAHSLHRYGDGHVWAHLSVSHRAGLLPSWEQVRDVQWLLYPGRAGLIVVAPPGEHYSIGEVAHVWTCLTGEPVPDFRVAGAI